MNWTEGHIWKALIQLPGLSKTFEYKYAVQDSGTGEIKRWEGGLNRQFDLFGIEKSTCNPGSHADSYRLKVKGLTIVYAIEKKHLIVLDRWQ